MEAIGWTIVLWVTVVIYAVALIIQAAYRTGYAAGVVAERERRMREEAETHQRMWRQVSELAKKDPELWDAEIDA